MGRNHGTDIWLHTVPWGIESLGLAQKAIKLPQTIERRFVPTAIPLLDHPSFFSDDGNVFWMCTKIIDGMCHRYSNIGDEGHRH